MLAPKSSRRRVLAVLPVLPALVFAGCSRDDLAPDCFEVVDGVCVIPDPGGTPPGIDCSTIPEGAVGADYTHEVTVGGGSGNYGDFMATNLPPGLMIDAGSGIISGVPEAGPEPGDAPMDYSVMLSVFDETKGQASEATCTLTVNPPLNALGLRSTDYHCLDFASTMQEMEAALEGGDGSPITCSLSTGGSASCPLGDGNGRLPPGITFDDTTCTHAGGVNSARLGTWVWMVTLEQSGYETTVPFCATNDVSTFHTITFTDGGDNDPLEPALYEYDATQNLGFGGGSHAWDIASPDCPGPDCNNFGFRFDVTCSPFDVSAPWFVTLEPAAQTATGLSHEMEATGPVPSADFEYRPWVASFELSYCTNADGAFCDTMDTDVFEANAQTKYHYDVLGYPTP